MCLIAYCEPINYMRMTCMLTSKLDTKPKGAECTDVDINWMTKVLCSALLNTIYGVHIGINQSHVKLTVMNNYDKCSI